MSTNNIEIIKRIESLETRLSEDISIRKRLVEMETELVSLRTQNREYKTILEALKIDVDLVKKSVVDHKDSSPLDTTLLSDLGSSGNEKRIKYVNEIAGLVNFTDDLGQNSKFLQFYIDLKFKMSLLGYANDFTEFEEKQANGNYSASGRLILRDFLEGPFLEKAHPNVKGKMKKLMTKDSLILNDGFKILSELFEIIIGKYDTYFNAAEVLRTVKFGENYDSIDGIKALVANIELLNKLYDSNHITEEGMVDILILNMRTNIVKKLVEWNNKDDKRKSVIEYTVTKLHSQVKTLDALYKLIDGYVQDNVYKEKSITSIHPSKDLRLTGEVSEFSTQSKTPQGHFSSVQSRRTVEQTSHGKSVKTLNIKPLNDDIIKLNQLKIVDASDIDARHRKYIVR